MMTLEERFRRNLVAVAIGHGVFIVGLIVFEWVAPSIRKSFTQEVELLVPADILGDLPKGPGVGRGAHAPPARAAAGVQASIVEKSPTPKARPTADPVRKLQAGEVAVPKKSTTKNTKVTKPEQRTTRKSVPANNTAVAGPSAADIRNRFARALGTQAGGTPYGDGRPGGGGQGRSSTIGSPNGSPNGVVGGVGQGTPFWWYYEHVHDRMYEAWEQPGEAVKWDKHKITTLVIRVARSGEIVEVRLKTPSGNPAMDQSALAAARSVQRLQALPDGLGGTTLDIPIDFQLES